MGRKQRRKASKRWMSQKRWIQEQGQQAGQNLEGVLGYPERSMQKEYFLMGEERNRPQALKIELIMLLAHQEVLFL